MKNIKWNLLQKPATQSAVHEVEQKLNVVFPDDYVEFAMLYHGAMPEIADFQYFDMERKIQRMSGLAQLLSFDPANSAYIVHHYEMLKGEHFPENVTPFGDTGGGDYICFDYRNDSAKPVVVLWKHEADVERSVWPLSLSFTEFLAMLITEE